MTFREWEKQFANALKGLSKQEKQTALEYYRELYGDKIDAGFNPDDIVTEFGSPRECAQNILTDNETKESNDGQTAQEKCPQATPSMHSVSSVIGMTLLTILLIIPLYAVLISVVVALGAICLSGGACFVVGALSTIAYPIYLSVYGASWMGITANAGICLATAGVGILLLIVFYFATKYMIIALVKLFKLIYIKEKKA
jgi:uncharacterized membrane protein